ncbi:deoxyribose-phosphate aldolase [Arthrobacter sp. NPDC056493]|uniref:Cgl0159 family (beta/alpha)8-fold protein n=1 Tax=Arthrobacter sp. NPDC056493 TaxID=3345839 RepID=UPI003672F1EA
MTLTPIASNSAVDDDPRRYEHLSTIRLQDPEAVARAAKARRRHPGLKYGRQNFIVAADHPARGALAVGKNPVAMADRRDLLDRLQIALANPAVDGILASPDIMDDLLLLGALEGKLVFGSMNRGGLSGLVNEFDDRFTGHTAAALEELGADGGKMLTRICLGDPDTVATLEATAKAIDSLAERKLIAMVEPFLSLRENGRVRNDLSTDAVIKSIGIAEGLGSTSAYTWMKLPVVDQMERVMAATTMPTVLLGGDPAGTQDEVFATWGAALALPGVQGLTVGRTLLYPADGDVAAAVAAAASLLNPTERAAQ